MVFSNMFSGDRGGMAGDPHASRSAPLFDSMFGRNLDAEGKGRRMMMGRALMSLGQGLASQQRGEHWASAATRGLGAVPGIIEDQEQRTRTAAFRERIGSMAEGEDDPTRRAWLETLGMLDPDAAVASLTSILGTGMQTGASRYATDVGAGSDAAALAFRERKAAEDQAYDYLVESGRMTRSEANIASQEMRDAANREARAYEGEATRGAAMDRALLPAEGAGGFSNAEIEKRNEVMAATARALEGTAGRPASWVKRVRGAEPGMVEFNAVEQALSSDIRMAMGSFAGESEEEYRQRIAGIIGDPGSGFTAPPVPDEAAGEEPPVVGTIYRSGENLVEFTGQGWELVTEEDLAVARRREHRKSALEAEFPGQEYMR